MKRLITIVSLILVCFVSFGQTENEKPNFSVRVKQDRWFSKVDAGFLKVNSSNSIFFPGIRNYFFVAESSHWRDDVYFVKIGESLEEALATIDKFIEACDGDKGEVMFLSNAEGEVISQFIVTGNDFSIYNAFGVSGGKGNSIRFIPNKDKDYRGMFGAYKSSLKHLRKKLERTSKRYGIEE